MGLLPSLLRPTITMTLTLRVLAFAASLVAAEAVAAPPLSSEYKLVLANPEIYRLAAAFRAHREAYEPHEQRAVIDPLQGQPFFALIGAAAREASVDAALVHAIIAVESRYNANAVSPKGAVGLMQVLPETAARYGVARPDRSPEENVKAGTRYLSDLMEQFGGRLELVLAAYNAGENAVRRFHGRIPPYPETQLYVPAVLEKYRRWKAAEHPGILRQAKHAAREYSNAQMGDATP